MLPLPTAARLTPHCQVTASHEADADANDSAAAYYITYVADYDAGVAATSITDIR